MSHSGSGPVNEQGEPKVPPVTSLLRFGAMPLGSRQSDMDETTVTRFIKEIGRGKNAARDLSREDAHILFSAMLAGEVSDLQLGGILSRFESKANRSRSSRVSPRRAKRATRTCSRSPRA